MLTKNDIRFVRSLSDKKKRQQSQLFVAEGDKACRDLIGSKISIKTIYATVQWLRQYTQIVPAACEVVEVSGKELGQLSRHAAPQEVIVLAHLPRNSPETFHHTTGLSLVLDTIQDPGNLGTILRTADWYGIKEIFCSPDTVDAFNPKVVDSSMGSIGRVNICYGDVKGMLKRHSLPVYGALLQGTSVYEAALETPSFLMIGNEGKGIREELLPLITHPISIPRIGFAESLNAAVAAAILCDHFAHKTNL